MTDYYEFLQISPHASAETIHRVYRFLASRYHPDNGDSGDANKFQMLRTAYDVLSDPEQRAKYDASRNVEAPPQPPLSTSIDFMDNLEGELNRRLAVLAVLYARRRTNPLMPEVALAEIERRLGFPRDYLDFTTWYLSKKGFITRADNADFTLTVDGVDFVETQRAKLPILNKLLTNGRVTASPRPADRRVEKVDRRQGLPDTRLVKVERRMNKADRRVNTKDRRQGLPDTREMKTGRRVTDSAIQTDH
jgi:DnaJ domain